MYCNYGTQELRSLLIGHPGEPAAGAGGVSVRGQVRARRCSGAGRRAPGRRPDLRAFGFAMSHEWIGPSKTPPSETRSFNWEQIRRQMVIGR